MSDENLKVTAALVDHPPVIPAFAYRFDALDRSIVISGDTAPSSPVSRAKLRRAVQRESEKPRGVDSARRQRMRDLKLAM